MDQNFLIGFFKSFIYAILLTPVLLYRSQIFENFAYLPEQTGIIRPQSSIASLDLWSYYSEDYLAHGSPYDIGYYFFQNNIAIDFKKVYYFRSC